MIYVHAHTYVHACGGCGVNDVVCTQGTLRVLLVLLHDFPEFLCDYHFSFCDVIPPNCIQMRNLILSAFPRNMRLPDPFTPNLKVSCPCVIQYQNLFCETAISLSLDSTYVRNTMSID